MKSKIRSVLISSSVPFLPVGSRRRRFLKALASRQPLPAASDLTYEEWISEKEPFTLSKVQKKGPLISIVVPCYNTPENFINQLIDSLKSQTYNRWQLCLADGSTDRELSKNIKNVAASDNRITYVKTAKNLGISGNTNAGLQRATGDYIAFLDHDDILPYWSLNEIVSAINSNPDADIFYSDEDRLSEDGSKRLFPLFKPDWSPDLFMCLNYVSHFFVIKKELADKIGGLRQRFDGSQDYDFMLRALDHSPNVHHIPRILYHMRMAETSTAKQVSVKDYAHIAGNAAISEYLKRNKIDAKVLEIPERPTNHRIKYAIEGKPLVSIIIPFKDKVELIETCVKSILEKTKYKNYEIILLSNNSVEKETHDYLASVKSNKKIKQFLYNKPFNYSAINNYGRQKASGEVLIFLNNDTEVINPEWLEELTSVAKRPEVGAVGPVLYYPDKTIQHAGVIVGMAGAAGHIFRNLKMGTFTLFWVPDWPRNYLAVTGACLAVEASKFDKVKGFDESIIVAGSDVTLCLALYESGLHNVYWPYAQLVHYESKSVGSYKNAPPTDYDRSMAKYRPYLNYHDPYFNPNIDLESEQLKLRSNYE